MQVENLSPAVFVVDDEESVRHSLKWLFGSVALDVKMYDSPQAFLDADISCSYGCLILDVRMRSLSGLQLQEALCERGFNLPIIFLSAYGDACEVTRAGRVGTLTACAAAQPETPPATGACPRHSTRRRAATARRPARRTPACRSCAA